MMEIRLEEMDALRVVRLRLATLVETGAVQPHLIVFILVFQ